MMKTAFNDTFGALSWCAAAYERAEARAYAARYALGAALLLLSTVVAVGTFALGAAGRISGPSGLVAIIAMGAVDVAVAVVAWRKGWSF